MPREAVVRCELGSLNVFKQRLDISLFLQLYRKVDSVALMSLPHHGFHESGKITKEKSQGKMGRYFGLTESKGKAWSAQDPV